jgi:hypothetical protein
VSHPLAQMLAQAEQSEKRIPHEGQVARLQEALELYQAPVTFEVGQLVTPRRGSPMTMPGEPHVVLEVDPDAAPDFGADEVGTGGYGQRPQVRVACVTRDLVAAFWVEAWHLEPYVEQP